MEQNGHSHSPTTTQSQASSIFSRCQRPVTLKFEDLVYKIKSKTNNGIQTSTILKGVSGCVHPGELLAMLGPSGSGKTTLLTALGGRLTTGHLAGAITCNGKPLSSSAKRSIGFVTQDDVLHPHLTVAETLLYTALLRLPATLSRQDKAAHAEDVMAQLGLAWCRNSIIGGPVVRGVSGGERKRVSIGQEMLANPSLLYLDEPTSGLDSTTAQRMVSTLRELTVSGGRTVVMTIHQPSSRLFYMFHKVLLLSDGNPIYFGKGSEAMDYFASIGYNPLVPMNPADFLLDLANGVSCEEKMDNQRATIKEALVSSYNLLLRNKVEKEEVQEIGSQSKECEPERMPRQWMTSWWQQFTVLLQRGLRERKRQSFSGLKIARVLAVAFIAGVLWWQSGGQVQDQVGLLFFMTNFWCCFPIFQAIYTFPQDRTMLTKERTSRMYRLSAYFTSRIVGDLPMELILPAVFTAVTYWMAGLKPPPSNFLFTLSVILLMVLVAQGIGLALGALIMDQQSTNALASVVMLTFMIAGGFYVQNVPSFIGWIKYISINFYSFKLLVASQFSPDETYSCTPTTTCKVVDIPSVAVVGFDHQLVAVAALLAMLFLYRLVSYLALMRIGVTR